MTRLTSFLLILYQIAEVIFICEYSCLHGDLIKFSQVLLRGFHVTQNLLSSFFHLLLLVSQNPFRRRQTGFRLFPSLLHFGIFLFLHNLNLGDEFLRSNVIRFRTFSWTSRASPPTAKVSALRLHCIRRPDTTLATCDLALSAGLIYSSEGFSFKLFHFILISEVCVCVNSSFLAFDLFHRFPRTLKGLEALNDPQLCCRNRSVKVLSLL
mmetsp:Transcript_23111/g.56087  ORF Transcript_23111/g.56087 Transcript_23111/m.56087 type:complete len:210 (+) Transcript_23111:415-1044(+)